MQQNFSFVPRGEIQLRLPLADFAALQGALSNPPEPPQKLRDLMSAETWAQNRAEDQAENQRLYRR